MTNKRKETLPEMPDPNMLGLSTSYDILTINRMKTLVALRVMRMINPGDGNVFEEACFFGELNGISGYTC